MSSSIHTCSESSATSATTRALDTSLLQQPSTPLGARKVSTFEDAHQEFLEECLRRDSAPPLADFFPRESESASSSTVIRPKDNRCTQWAYTALIIGGFALALIGLIALIAQEYTLLFGFLQAIGAVGTGGGIAMVSSGLTMAGVGFCIMLKC